MAKSCNDLAWVLIAGPEFDRDPPRALRLAHRAVALVPDSDMYLNTLGLALYRTAWYDEAIPVLERRSPRTTMPRPLTTSSSWPFAMHGEDTAYRHELTSTELSPGNRPIPSCHHGPTKN